MKNIYRLLIVVLAWGSLPALGQNQLHLSQYMMHQPFLNPAAAGSYEYLNAALVYRKQWVGFDGAPSVQGLNFNVPFKTKKSHLGLNLFNDKIGVNKRMDVAATYAYRLSLSETKSLAFGLSAGIATLQSNLADVELVDPTDPVFSANTQIFVAPDFRFGLYYFTKKFYAGFALPRLLDNKIVFEQAYSKESAFSGKALHYHLHSGYVFKLSEKMDLNTSVLLKQNSGAPLQIDLNAQVNFNNVFGVGASYRTTKEMIALANFQITKYFRLCYAYDYSFTQLNDVSSGTHEIMLIFNLVQEKQPVRIDAPRF